MICAPLIPIMYSASGTVVTTLYSSGIEESYIILISKLFSYYSLSFIGIALYSFMAALYLTINKTKFYSTIAIIVQILIFILNTILYKRFTIDVFPLIFGLCHFLAAVILIFKVDKGLRNQMFQFLGKFLTIIIIFTIIAFYLNKMINNYLSLHIIIFNIILGMAFLLITYLLSYKSIKL